MKLCRSPCPRPARAVCERQCHSGLRVVSACVRVCFCTNRTVPIAESFVEEMRHHAPGDALLRTMALFTSAAGATGDARGTSAAADAPSSEQMVRSLTQRKRLRPLALAVANPSRKRARQQPDVRGYGGAGALEEEEADATAY